MNYNLASKSRTFRNAVSAALLTAGMLAPVLAYSADADDKSSSVGQAVTDTAISTKVRAKFASDSRIHDSNISVNTTNGKVTLSGSVANSTMKAVATEIATGTDGVKSVDNDLTPVVATTLGDETSKTARETGHTVKHAANETGAEIGDGYVTTKIKSKLLATKNLSSTGISVDTNDGAVTLSGHVPTAAQKAKAISVTRHTKGVKSVDAGALEIVAE